MLRALLTFFCLTLVAFSVSAQLSDEEIESILDVEAGGLTLSKSGGAYLEEVVSAEARNGSYLRVVCPNNSQVQITMPVTGPSTVVFDCNANLNTGLSMVASFINDSYFEFNLPESGVGFGEWDRAHIPVQREADTFTLTMAYFGAEGDEELVVLLDDLMVDSRRYVGTFGRGLDIEFVPDRELFEVGEYVQYKVVPQDADLEFIEWGNGVVGSFGFYNSGDGPEGVLEVEGHAHLLALGGRRYDFDGAVLVASADSFETVELQGEGDEASVELLQRPSTAREAVYARVTGPGLLRFWGEAVEGQGSGYLMDRSLAEGREDFGIWIGAGKHVVPIERFGSVRIGGLRLDDVAEVSVTTVGAGMVTGVPESGLADIGSKLTLEAIPAEGWLFGGWEGSVGSSEESIEVTTVGVVDLVARFYKEVVVDGVDTLIDNDVFWVLGESEFDALVDVDGPLPAHGEASILWKLSGPRTFAIDYSSSNFSGKILVDGKLEARVSESSYGPDEKSVDIALGAGAHTVELRLLNNRDYEGYGVLTIDALRVGELVEEPSVWPVSVRPTLGGSVEGLEGVGESIADGESLQLTAVAEEGYSFKGWFGSLESEGEEIEFVVGEPVTLVAVFEKETSELGLFSSQYGFGDWEWSGDVLSAPAGLSGNEFSRVTGAAAGGARLSFKVAGSGGASLSWGVDGEVLGSASSGTQTITFAEDAETFYLEVSFGGALTVSELKLEYPVSVSLDGGSLTFTPYLSDWDNDGIYTDYFEAGTELEWTAGAGVEIDWEGDFEGLNGTDSIVVDRPLTASGTVDVSEVVWSDLVWDIESEGGLSIVNVGGVSGVAMSPAFPDAVFSTTLEGPGLLYLHTAGLVAAFAELDGEAFTAFSDSYGSTQFIIPSGEHWFRFFASIDENAYDSNSQWYVSLGIKGVNYLPGFVGYGTSVAGGGSVVLDPTGTNGVYEAGTVVSVTATPGDGNRFVSWKAPYASEALDFSITVDDHFRAEAIFEALDEVGGYLWDYKGPRNPIFGEGYRETDPDRLIWYFDDDGDVGFNYGASAQVEGGGVLRFEVIHDGRTGILPDVRIDGEAVEVRLGSNEISLASGTHDFEMDFVVPDIANGYAVAGISIPELITELSLQVEGGSAEILVEGEKEIYGYGDVVTLTAPATDGAGDGFLAWTDGYGGAVLSREREVSLQMNRNYRYFALYGNAIISNDLVIALSNSDQVSDVELSPDGEESFGFSGYGYVEFKAIESVWMRFALKTASGATFSGATSGQTYSFEEAREWAVYSAYVEAGKTFRIQSLGIDSWIGDIEIQEGWGPTIYPNSDGRLSFSEDLAVLDEGGVLELSPDPEDSGRFYGWSDKSGNLLEGETVSVPFGSADAVFPLWGDTIETDIGPVKRNLASGWVPKLINGELGRSWVLRSAQAIGAEQRFSFEVEGLAFFSFSFHQFYGGENTLKMYLDGVEVDLSDTTLLISSPNTNGSSPVFTVSEGVHTVEFVHLGQIEGYIDLYLSEVESGYFISGGNFEGGEREISVERGAVDPGTVVQFYARPDWGYVFDRWEAPYENEGAVFSLEIRSPDLPVPVFKPKRQSFEYGGLSWIGESIRLNANDEVKASGDQARLGSSLEVSFLDDDRSWIETTIEGPAVVRGKRWVLDRGTTLDGAHLGEKALTFDIQIEDDNGYSFVKYTHLAVPEGEHKLRIMASYTGASNPRVELDEDFEVRPGYLVVVDGLGVEVSVAPAKLSYELGEEVVVTALGVGGSSSLEWLGLPDDAVIEGATARFEVDQHLKVEVANWKSVRLDGMAFEYAGDNEWNKSIGKGRLTHDAFGERSLLRLEPGRRGYWDFGFGILSNGTDFGPIAVGLEKNGIEQFSGSAFPIGWNASIRVDSEEDALQWAFLNVGYSNVISDGVNINFGGVRLSSVTTSLYLSWWNRYDSSGVLVDELLDPVADLDRDGYSNYLEYLLDSDPWRWDGGLAIEQVAPSGDLYLVRPDLLGVDSIDWVIETSTQPNGRWEDAYPVLGDDIEGDSILNKVLAVPEVDEPVFFRGRVEVDAPTLDELLGE